MNVPEGVSCQTCPFFQTYAEWRQRLPPPQLEVRTREDETLGLDAVDSFGQCWLLPTPARKRKTDFCGHHPLWQEIVRREAAAKLGNQKVRIAMPVRAGFTQTVEGEIVP